MYAPKYLYEISRIQLRDCNTPDKHQSKNNLIERGRKSSFTLLMSGLPQAVTGHHWRDYLSLSYFPWEKERVKYASNTSRLLYHCPKDLLLSHFPQSEMLRKPQKA